MLELGHADGGDARIVSERTEIVVHVLQSFVARRGGGAGRSADVVAARCDAAVATLSTLSARARTVGWAGAFDDALAELRALAAAAHRDERDELSRLVEAFMELDPAVLRLARRDLRAPDARAPASPAARLRPSLGAPALHADPRAPREIAAASSGFVEPRALDQLRRSARDAIEEIATLFYLRHPADDMPWSTGAAFDQRVLDALDACAAYERGRASLDVEALALQIARGFPIVDSARWFAALFLLACTDGERPINALRQILLELPEAALDAGVDALALGSNPRLSRVARSLLDEDDRPRALQIGLRAMERLHRGELGAFDAAPLLALVDHPDDRIASLAAIGLARGEPGDVGPPLTALLDRPGVALAAARSLALRGANPGAEAGLSFLRQTVARGLLDGAREEDVGAAGAAARTLVHAGATRDEAALAQAALHAPDTDEGDATIEALADHGAPAFIPLLVQILQRTHRGTRKLAASRAIERITGIAPERDPASPADLDLDAQAAAADALRAPLGVARMRHGRKLDRAAAIADLADPNARAAERRRNAIGASFLVGRPLDLDTEGWVARQIATLAYLTGDVAKGPQRS